MLSLDKINFGDLKKAVEALNECGVLSEPLKTGFIKKETLLKQFAESIEAVDEKDQDKLPELVIVFYNDNIAAEDEEEPAAEEEEAEAEEVNEEEVETEEAEEVKPEEVVAEEEKEIKETAKDRKVTQKKKKAKAKRAASGVTKKAIPREGPKGRYGHIVGTQADNIDENLFKGDMTSTEIAKASFCAVSRVNAHIKHLREKRGIEVTEGTNKEGRKTFSTKLEKWEKPKKENK